MFLIFFGNPAFAQQDPALAELDAAFLNEIKTENKALSERIKQLPVSAREQNAKISAALKQNQDDEALNLALELEKMLPENADVKHFIGKMYSKKNNHQQALNYFESALKIDTKNKWFYINKATTLASLEKMDEALTTTDQVIALFPEWSLGYNLKASFLHRMNQQSESLKTYELAMNATPKSAVIYCNRGDLYLELSKETEAVSDYKQALQIEPNYSRATKKLLSIAKNDQKSTQN